MMKILGIFILIILSLVIIYFFILEKVEPIQRPENVPVEAIYEGGSDGGNWITYNQYKDSSNVFYCEVYNQYTGNILYKGLFRLENGIITLSELKKESGIYSGNYIFLKDGRKLKTVVQLDSVSHEQMMNRTIDNPY